MNKLMEILEAVYNLGCYDGDGGSEELGMCGYSFHKKEGLSQAEQQILALIPKEKDVRGLRPEAGNHFFNQAVKKIKENMGAER